MVIPEDWQELTLGDICRLSAAPAKKADGSRYVILDMGSVARDGSLLSHKRTDSATDVLDVGDLVMPKDDIGGGQIIGKVVVVTEPDRFVLGDHVYRLRLGRGCPAFIRYAINSRRVNASLRSKVVGSAQLGLGRKAVLEQAIPFPPVNEQEAIAEALSDADAAIEALDALIAKKRDVKQAAMQQLLTGSTRLPGFSEVWLDTTIGGVAQAISGGTPSTAIAAYWDGGIPWCTPTDITATRGRYLKSTERTITQLGISSSGASLLPAGALLLCTRATIGEVRIAAQPTATNQGFKSLVVRPGTSNIFLYYLLSTLRPKFIERASGSTFLEIGRGDLVSVDIRIPQENEQAAIAEVLSDMDADLEALVAERDKTRLVKQGMMQELLSGRVRLV